MAQDHSAVNLTGGVSSAPRLSLALVGAAGRMGKSLLTLLSAEPQLTISALVESPSHPLFGNPLADLTTSAPSSLNPALRFVSSLKAACEQGAVFDGVIDFSLPHSTLSHLDELLRIPSLTAPLKGLADPFYIVGTTGFTPAEEAQINRAAQQLVLVKSGNFSVGVQVLLRLVEQAATHLGMDFDLEITETHHREKVDAPSGTANMLLDAALAGNPQLKKTPQAGRHGRQAKRKLREIGMHSRRGGGVVGEHEALFLAKEEKLTLSHTAFTRRAFTSGVLRAIAFAQHQRQQNRPGQYSMKEVLAG